MYLFSSIFVQTIAKLRLSTAHYCALTLLLSCKDDVCTAVSLQHGYTIFNFYPLLPRHRRESEGEVRNTSLVGTGTIADNEWPLRTPVVGAKVTCYSVVVVLVLDSTQDNVLSPAGPADQPARAMRFFSRFEYNNS
jgi:hypothetical protein